MRQDTCFDGLAEPLEEDIYGASKGRIRQAVLWTDLIAAVPELARGGLSVLDAGGGAGHMAVRMAASGNRVVLCDTSREMLERAQERIRRADVHEHVSPVHASIQDLHTKVRDRFDVVACHAVLEWLADPEDALGRLVAFVKPDGRLSLLFYNRAAALQRRIFRGEYADACRELKEGCAPRGWRNGCIPLAEAAVRDWLERLGFKVRSKAGIRIFHDYLPEALRAPEYLDDLLSAEIAFRRQEPFASLGHHLHFVCERAR